MKSGAAIALSGLMFMTSCQKEQKYGIYEKSTEEVEVFDKQVEGEAEMIDRAERIQKTVDDIFMKNNAYVELYIKKDGEKEIKRVDNFDNIRDKSEIEAIYNIVRYDNGSLKNVTEIYSQNDRDFENIYNTLYNEQGNIVKFQRLSRFQIEGGSQFIETSTYYFDENHDVFKKDYKVIDLFNMEKQVDAKDVETSPGRIEYRIYRTAKDFNDAHPIK